MKTKIINTRVNEHTLSLIDRAARKLGKSRSNFIVTSALLSALDVLDSDNLGEIIYVSADGAWTNNPKYAEIFDPTMKKYQLVEE